MDTSEQDPRIRKFLQYELGTLKIKLDLLEKHIQNNTLDEFFTWYSCFCYTINYYLPVILATTTYFYTLQCS